MISRSRYQRAAKRLWGAANGETLAAVGGGGVRGRSCICIAQSFTPPLRPLRERGPRDGGWGLRGAGRRSSSHFWGLAERPSRKSGVPPQLPQPHPPVCRGAAATAVKNAPLILNAIKRASRRRRIKRSSSFSRWSLVSLVKGKGEERKEWRQSVNTVIAQIRDCLLNGLAGSEASSVLLYCVCKVFSLFFPSASPRVRRLNAVFVLFSLFRCLPPLFPAR